MKRLVLANVVLMEVTMKEQSNLFANYRRPRKKKQAAGSEDDEPSRKGKRIIDSDDD
jgi:hypothetical protein